jgi:LacI family transcriptional regulator
MTEQSGVGDGDLRTGTPNNAVWTEMMAPNTKRATIRDVARAANVSIKTVSRVVRQEPNVSAETRAIVEAVIEKLSYRPTVSARSSVGARSYMLGLLFDNPNPSYIADLIHGAFAQARSEGYHLAVEPVDGPANNVAEDVARFVVQSNLDGVILPPPICDRRDILDALRVIGKPVVRIAPNAEKGDELRVAGDDLKAARAITRHLIQLGHTRIAMVSGRSGTATTRRRISGFLAAMQEADIPVSPDWIVTGNYQYKSGLDAGLQLLMLDDRPTAIFAGNDDMAAGVLAAAFKLGLVVPADVSVAGFDDSVIATVVWPQLTTVRQPVREMAANAVSNLIARIKGMDAAVDAVLPTFDLVVRGSTGGAPIKVRPALK